LKIFISAKNETATSLDLIKTISSECDGKWANQILSYFEKHEIALKLDDDLYFFPNSVDDITNSLMDLEKEIHNMNLNWEIVSKLHFKLSHLHPILWNDICSKLAIHAHNRNFSYKISKRATMIVAKNHPHNLNALIIPNERTNSIEAWIRMETNNIDANRNNYTIGNVAD
jgi:hypothetical protein